MTIPPLPPRGLAGLTGLLPVVALTGLMLAPQVAHAQGTDEFGAYGGLENANAYESPQKFALEVRFGRYIPRVDDEFASATPYEDVFGKKKRYQLGLEFDWQALRIPKVGSFGPGIGIGYTTSKAQAIFTDSTERSAEKTSLRLLPAYLVGVLRVDALAQETPIPLAAYAKAGLGFGMWWAVGEEHLERYNGSVGKGAEYGLQLALGGMLLLDTIDRRGAAEMDNSTGVNNAYLFLEWTYSDIDSFGDGLQMGVNTWTTGLALEF